jgi:hypothetical protein
MAEEPDAIELKAVAMEPNDCPLVRCTALPPHWVARLSVARARQCTVRAPVRLLLPSARSVNASWRAGVGANRQVNVQDHQARRKGRLGPKVHGRYGFEAQAHWFQPSLLVSTCLGVRTRA